MVLQLLTVAVPATMFAYITVLTGFRFVTLDLDNYAESMLYCLGMAGLFSLSYLLLTKTENNQEQISTQLQRQLQVFPFYE